jgi:4-hydroxybenzoate polyprenyltransferase
MTKVSNYLSLVKFSHTVFAMPFALIGYFTAIYSHDYGFDLQKLVLILLCMIFARNAAMGFNRYIDRNYDKLNPRTAGREIPSKILSPRSVLIFVIINSAAFIITTWFINTLCFALSPVALIVVLGYSYTKRYTWLCHIILGLGLSLAPVGAYIAVTSYFNITAILYSITVLFWVAGFDIIYALNDKDFDNENKLYSIPSFFGEKYAMILSIIFHLISTVCIVIIAFVESFEYLAWTGSGIFISLLIIQHIIIMKDKRNINAAFFLTNGLAGIFLSVGIILEMIINYY